MNNKKSVIKGLKGLVQGFLLLLMVFTLIGGIGGERVWAASSVKYSMNGTVMTISGSGRMPDKLNFGSNPKTKKVTEVVIKEGVTTVSKQAFKDCTSLKKVTLPEGLLKIEEEAFYNTGLEQVTIPNSVLYMGNHAFDSCQGLKEVTAPAAIKVYGLEVDENETANLCQPLETLTLTSPLDQGINSYRFTASHFRTRNYVIVNDPNFATYKGAIYTKDFSRLCYVSRDAETFELAPECREFSFAAFTHYLGDDYYATCDKLDRVVIPAWVTKIAPGEEEYRINGPIEWVFENKDLDFESIMNVIGFLGFDKAADLFPETVKTVNGWQLVGDDYLYGLTAAKKKSLQKKKLLKLPEGIRVVGSQVFREWSGLQELVLPEGLEEIGEYAFSYCRNLTKVSFPESLAKIGENAFFLTRMGDSIPDSWQADKESFYRSYEDISRADREYALAHNDPAEIDCSSIESSYMNYDFQYTPAMSGKTIKLNIKEDGLLLINASKDTYTLKNEKGKKINNCSRVKAGEAVYLKLPKIKTYFNIKSCYVAPVNSRHYSLADSDNWYYATGKKQYIYFDAAERLAGFVQITDLNRVADPGITIYVQKKTDGKWVTVKEAQEVKAGKKFDSYTHLTGTYSKKLGLGLDAGRYRFVLKAAKGTCLKLWASYYSFDHPYPQSFGADRTTAAELNETDYDLEYREYKCYSEDIFTYEDESDSRWYRYDKKDRSKETVELWCIMLSAGELTVNIYRNSDTKPIKTMSIKEKTAGGEKTTAGADLTGDEKTAAGAGLTGGLEPSWNDEASVRATLDAAGTYYFELIRSDKTVTGCYALQVK